MDYVLQKSDGSYVTINSDNRFHRYRKHIYKKSIQLGSDVRTVALLWAIDNNQREYALELKRFIEYIEALTERGDYYIKRYIYG